MGNYFWLCRNAERKRNAHLQKKTPFQFSLELQRLRNIKLSKVSWKHDFLMLFKDYRTIYNDNVRLNEVLQEKERKLARADAQVIELSKANEHHFKLARERKLEIKRLKENA